ncbi:hypothetical protein KS461_10650 [Pseudomonas chlororaphis]|uniref:hypothetical protein n=1 Tax=Pseudomonas chlororaphis TaxID=587753 RepID=UPI00215B0242|nr:hypothetical protein [Pseudomonas chlororaphis]UVE47706.1 hypothetical protein KS461_10650 [Pseudomonas chlororaphis]
MDERQYFIDEEGRIASPVSCMFSEKKYACEPTYEAALKRLLIDFREECLDPSGYALTPSLIADLKLQHYLGVEDGLCLVTGIYFDIIASSTTFYWGGNVFFPIRPDLAYLAITRDLNVVPLNPVERETLNFMSMFSDYFDALFLAIEAEEIFVHQKYTFDWWSEFWKRRGVNIAEYSLEPKCSATNAEAKPSHLLAIAAMLELLGEPSRGARNQSAVVAEILERHPGKRGLGQRNLESIFAAANRASKEAE